MLIFEHKRPFIDTLREFDIDVIIGGPPCQGFSRMNPYRDGNEKYDHMNALPQSFVRIALRLDPKIIIMEEVAMFAKTPGFSKVMAALQKAGYHVTNKGLNAQDFGVTQNRKRNILIASKLSMPLHHPQPSGLHLTAGHMLRRAPIPPHGDVLHGGTLSLVTTRTQHIPDTFRSNHTIMRLDRPAPTILTNFHIPGKGQFTIKRGDSYYRLSPEEGARLQGFPPWFKFVGKKTPVCRQIGNAIPPPLAYAVGMAIMEQLSIP